MASASASLRDADDLVDREIGLERPLAPADLIGLVGLEAVQRELVLLGIDRDRLDAELGRRAEHPDRDLGTVGDKNAPKRNGHQRFVPLSITELRDRLG